MPEYPDGWLDDFNSAKTDWLKASARAHEAGMRFAWQEPRPFGEWLKSYTELQEAEREAVLSHTRVREVMERLGGISEEENQH